MISKNKIELSVEPCINQINYNTENPPTEELSEVFFWELPESEKTEEQTERDTIYSLLAEMRGI